jgi:hypothetical protein
MSFLNNSYVLTLKPEDPKTHTAAPHLSAFQLLKLLFNPVRTIAAFAALLEFFSSF